MSNMDLPKGKTCGDCVNWIKCNGLFMCKPEETVCDFYPIKFVDNTPTNKRSLIGDK